MTNQDRCIIEPFTPWQKTTKGGVITSSGNAHEYETGGWRADKPIWDKEKCKQCLMCFPVCPDSSILAKDKKMVGIDYNHCKGCGICSNVCPFHAIHMVKA